MAKFKKKSKKNAIAQEKVDTIRRYSNEDLAKALSAEYADISKLEMEKRKSPAIKELASELKEIKEKVEGDPDVTVVKRKVDEVKEEFSEVKAKKEGAHAEEVREDLKALKQGYTGEIRERKKVLNFMLEELKKRYGTGGIM